MLKIAPVRASLGKSVTAKTKNKKDDLERIIEFSLSELSLTQLQLSDLVACNKHERAFADLAFVSKDSVSELRHFKKIEMAIEVHDATITLELIGTRGQKLKLHNCSLKGINLTFSAAERCEMSCKVWAPLEEHALFKLSEWGLQNLFVSIQSKEHGAEDVNPNAGLDL